MAQENPPLLAEPARMTADWPDWRWTVLAGDDALSSGLPAMADSLYRNVLAQDIAQEAKQAVEAKLVSALIAQRRFEEASDLLLKMPEPGNSAVSLRRAIVALNLGEIERATEAMKDVRDERLSRGDQPWSHLVRGLLARAKGDNEEASTSIERAIETSVSPIQQAQFDALLLTTRVSEEIPDSELISFLADKTRENEGTRPGFGYAREYAVVLDRAGQKAAAIELLQDQLSMITADEQGERAQTLLMIGLIAGPNTRRGQLALEDIIKDAREPKLARVAMYLLAEAERDTAQTEAFREFLSRQIENPQNPIRDEMLMLRAQKQLGEGKPEAATSDAERILAEFPASAFTNKARFILARLAWETGRYRAAADFLQKIQETLPTGLENTRLSQLIGDCYFQNEDFPTSAAIYSGALQDLENTALRSQLAYQAIISYILADELTEAATLIDSEAALEGADPIRLWRAEWNLVDALRQQGKSAEAFTRLSLKLSESPLSSIEPELGLRLMWLWAFVYYEAGQYDQVPKIAKDARALIASEAGAELPDPEKRLLASSLTLLEARADLQAGKAEEALGLFTQLRDSYPGTEAAIASYLIEARFLANEYQLVEAQQRLRELADYYPDSPLAPTALLEAATLAEKQGQDRNLAEASDILRVLIERYPGQPIIFHAKLRLGNVMRKQNNFAAAQLFYENILQEYVGSTDQYPLYLAELYRADSILAMAGDDSLRLDSAVEGLDRVLDDKSSPVDARIEAAYKQALIFVRQGNSLRARETLWQMVTRILKNPEVASSMGSRGRYWMARALLELGNQMEIAGSPSEAFEVYKLIKEYGLPGQAVVRNRLETTSLN